VVYFLVYVSSATTLWSQADLDDILATSRRNNDHQNISGMLLYKGGNLMQMLEGEESTVCALYAKIALDQRHRGILKILDGTSEARQFPRWSMAFRDLDGADARALPGYSDFMNTRLAGAEFAADPTLGQKLLTMFKTSR
jgi:FAD-dependent sensor of blue light